MREADIALEFGKTIGEENFPFLFSPRFHRLNLLHLQVTCQDVEEILSPSFVPVPIILTKFLISYEIIQVSNFWNIFP